MNDRALYFARLSSIDDWPAELDEPKPHFVVFLAVDATSLAASPLAALAKKLIKQGMVYLCAWGPDCERVHDAFDSAADHDQSTDDAFLITTWHKDEDLDDTLWFAVVATLPSADYIETCRAVLAIVVADPGWAERVEHALANFDDFSESLFPRA